MNERNEAMADNDYDGETEVLIYPFYKEVVWEVACFNLRVSNNMRGST